MNAPTVRGTPAVATLESPMADVQSLADSRRLAIDKVGVKNVVYPITLRTPCGKPQTTVATIDMYVSLPHDRKGTHMSRFLEALNEHRDCIRPEQIITMCQDLRERLDAKEAHVRVEFTYFIEKLAPVSKQPGLMDYRVTFECASNGFDDFVMKVAAPAASLCPCSKEISRYGAHNQRCEITAEVRFQGQLWIEDVVGILEKAASSELYSILKRPDEKFVTEAAYESPKFVEDIVRDAATALNRDDRIVWYRVRSENFESIHNHNAYAEITRDKRST
ncbi:MAG: GTP cyclohydrolase I FolE2 [Phycisphaerales bacterium]|nr:GTP cyclohydrolase I FolE2 [Phycisphaerales bacterium]